MSASPRTRQPARHPTRHRFLCRAGGVRVLSPVVSGQDVGVGSAQERDRGCAVDGYGIQSESVSRFLFRPRGEPLSGGIGSGGGPTNLSAALCLPDIGIEQ